MLHQAGRRAIVELHWHGKFRGPDFAPIPFKITAGRTEKLKDSDGGLIWTVTAAPVTDAEQATAENTARRREDDLMAAMRSHPEAGSLSDLARAAGWSYANGEPNKTWVNRTLQTLKAERLVEKKRGRWLLAKGAAGRGARRGPVEDEKLPF